MYDILEEMTFQQFIQYISYPVNYTALNSNAISSGTLTSNPLVVRNRVLISFLFQLPAVQFSNGNDD